MLVAWKEKQDFACGSSVVQGGDKIYNVLAVRWGQAQILHYYVYPLVSFTRVVGPLGTEENKRSCYTLQKKTEGLIMQSLLTWMISFLLVGVIAVEWGPKCLGPGNGKCSVILDKNFLKIESATETSCKLIWTFALMKLEESFTFT